MKLDFVSRFKTYLFLNISICRATAVMYMRRAGLSWETIVKITGHKSTVNLVKFYDLKLEAQGESLTCLLFSIFIKFVFFYQV